MLSLLSVRFPQLEYLFLKQCSKCLKDSSLFFFFFFCVFLVLIEYFKICLQVQMVFLLLDRVCSWGFQPSYLFDFLSYSFLRYVFGSFLNALLLYLISHSTNYFPNYSKLCVLLYLTIPIINLLNSLLGILSISFSVRSLMKALLHSFGTLYCLAFSYFPYPYINIYKPGG